MVRRASAPSGFCTATLPQRGGTNAESVAGRGGRGEDLAVRGALAVSVPLGSRRGWVQKERLADALVLFSGGGEGSSPGNRHH